jgi:nitroreductase
MQAVAGANSSRSGVAHRVLELARWAPSGDNSQPWRFEIRNDDHVVVHAFDTRDHCVYDLRGHASQLAVGSLLETLRIAASASERVVRITRRPEAPEDSPTFDVLFEAAPGLARDALADAIRDRSVVRKPLSTRPLASGEKLALEQAAGDRYRVVWFDGWRQRLRVAWLALYSAKIRLTIPEAYAVHRDIIEWDAQFSDDKVPDQALGADALTLRSMRWAMATWPRVEMMNRYFGGTVAPRLQLDLIPGIRCAAHFALVARSVPQGVDDFVCAGGAVQRFWLTATSLGLRVQPQYTPLAFAEYVREKVRFTSVESARRRAQAVERRLAGLLGEEVAPATVFLGRIGQGPAPLSRSLRLPMERLMVSDSQPKSNRLGR